MGDHGVGHTAFKWINKFNDDKTEQVWELFSEEFARASVAEDGETSWRIAAGIMSVDDTNNQISEEDTATVISDIASSSSSSIQVTASWIENKDGKDQLADTGVLLARCRFPPRSCPAASAASAVDLPEHVHASDQR